MSEVKLPVLLVQPPFTQLNSPYPAIYYLRSFLEQKGRKVIVNDHSISLFEKIFSGAGFAKIFADAKAACLLSTRFISEKDRLLSSVDHVVDFLRGKNYERGHFIALANGTLPGGPRFDACLANLRNKKSDAGPDDAPLLATCFLADLADFITQTLDEGFSLIRYMPSIQAGFRNFSSIKKSLGGYVMDQFYRPFLDGEWEKLSGEMPGKFILGISVPFPGCLAGALVCAKSAKAFFGDRVVVVAGGGYVNTELRYLEDERLFNYFDYLCFDRGYGPLDAVLKREEAGKKNFKTPLYKTMYRDNSGVIVKDKNIDNICNVDNDEVRIDDEAVRTVFPDYSSVDFSRYIRPVDDVNPMHRLWSDGRWLKAYLAHGCYRHNCSFCDTSLDYIRSYNPVDTDALFRHLLKQADMTGVRGVHFVDEACPPASLLRFAMLNREAGLPLVFWGNIRLENYFTPDTAAVLAESGLIGVSAGIEVATEKGLERIGKGFDLQGAVDVCAAFKEAGILIHAYLIYGYWDEDDLETADSAETVRQFFEHGILDSAFWHKFTLTRHSRIFAEKQQGMHLGLGIRERGMGNGDAPIGTAPSCVSPIELAQREPPKKPSLSKRQVCFSKLSGRRGNKKTFSLNDLSFDGEELSDRFTKPLNRLLRKWMNGETFEPLCSAFPAPSVPSDLVMNLLDSYARRRDRERKTPPDAKQPLRVVFLGSKPFTRQTKTGCELVWRRRFEDCTLSLKPGQAQPVASFLEKAGSGKGIDTAEFFGALEKVFGNDVKRVWGKLRRQGLAVV